MEKTEKLLQLISMPEAFSPEERRRLLADEETSELYSLLCAISAKENEPDTITDEETDIEWNRFVSRRAEAERPDRRLLLKRPFRQTAAAIAVLFSAAAIATIGFRTVSDPITHASSAIEIPVAEKPAVPTESVATSSQQSDREERIKVFDNETLHTIVDEIAAYFDVNTDYRSDSASDLRLHFEWDKTLSLHETLESLNSFDHISISTDGKTIRID